VIVPYNVDVPMPRWPLANWAFVAVTIVVSVGLWVGQVRERVPDFDKISGGDPVAAREEAERLKRLGEQPPALALSRSQFAAGQLFTYTLVHSGFLHLLGNMIFLFCFGNALDAKLGHLAFAACYAGLGALTGLAWLYLDTQGLYLVGASGAIAGITGMFLVLYPRNLVRVFYMFGYASGFFEVQSYWFIAAFMTMDVVGTLLLHGDGIAYVCHLGAQLCGIALAVLLLETGLLRSETYEENLLQVLGLRKLNRPKYGKKNRKRPNDDAPTNEE
jgi:membrane associated rhomboid family serine protease